MKVADTNQNDPDIIRKFTGQFDFVLDAKGRVSIPARIREIIERDNLKDLTLRLFEEDGVKFIRAYPTDYYSVKILGKLSEMDGESMEQTFAIMRITANAQQVKVDGQGRLNIPGDMLKKSKISKDIRFVGMNSFFDIWDPEVCDEFRAKMLERMQNRSGNENGGSS